MIMEWYVVLCMITKRFFRQNLTTRSDQNSQGTKRTHACGTTVCLLLESHCWKYYDLLIQIAASFTNHLRVKQYIIYINNFYMLIISDTVVSRIGQH